MFSFLKKSAPAAQADATPESPAAVSWRERLFKGLARTRAQLGGKLKSIFSRGKVFAGRGNSVIVLDPATDAVIKTVTYENRQVKDLAKGYDGKIYAIFTGEFTGNSGMTGAASFTKPAMIVALDANGEVVSETNLPEQIELRTGTASPTVQMCASFTQPHLYFIGKQDFSAYEAMRYNYETGKVNWDYITADPRCGSFGRRHHLRLHGRTPDDRTVMGRQIDLYAERRPCL